MKTLAEIAASFARLDGIEENGFSLYEKDLRNLAQRQYLPPSDRKGRIFLYDVAATAVIRLAQIAHEFGVPRVAVDDLTTFLLTPMPPEEDGCEWHTAAAEMITVAQAGQTFAVHVVMDAQRRYRVESDLHMSPRARRLADLAPEIARFTLPASVLINQVSRG